MLAGDIMVALSRYAGDRFDLVQAGGGNSSVKAPEGMLIKSSGVALGEVAANRGQVLVDLDRVLEVLERFEPVGQREVLQGRSAEITSQLSQTLLGGVGRPSIETFMHALTSRITLHTHPLAICGLAMREDSREIFGRHYPEALYIEYATPGIELALKLKAAMRDPARTAGGPPKVVILENHGLLVSSDELDEVFDLTEKSVMLAEKLSDRPLDHYRWTTAVARLISAAGGTDPVCRLATSSHLAEIAREKPDLLFFPPACPDQLVYCGVRPVEIHSLDDLRSIEDFQSRYGTLPRIVLYRGFLYLVADSLKKVREMEDVLTGHLEMLMHAGDKPRHLPPAELEFLDSWDAEKFRRKV